MVGANTNTVFKTHLFFSQIWFGMEIFNIEELKHQNKGVFTKINARNGPILMNFSAILLG